MLAGRIGRSCVRCARSWLGACWRDRSHEDGSPFGDFANEGRKALRAKGENRGSGTQCHQFMPACGKQYQINYFRVKITAHLPLQVEAGGTSTAGDWPEINAVRPPQPAAVEGEGESEGGL